MPPTILAPGARIVVRDEEWLVRRSHKANPGGSAIYVTGVSDLVRGKESIFLTDLDKVTELAPESTGLVTDDSPQYRKTRLYLEAMLRRTSPPAGDDRIYLGNRGAINESAYQLEPAAKALRQPRPRLLIADGVGLGKTIEVGILLTELIERGRADRILVVALKSILSQFQQELWGRFTIPLVRLDSVGIQRVQAKIPSSMNPFHYFDRVIVSIDTLKKDAKYRRYLEQCRWDVIVIDECQNVADKSGAKTIGRGASQRAQLARLLSRTSDGLILTSATPHDGKAESFASVIQLLEQTAIADRSNYTHEDVKDYYVRRFKKDLKGAEGDAFKERISRPQHVDASTHEDAAFARLNDLEFKTVTNQRNARGVLFRILLLKSFLSSPAACMSTIDERLKTLGKLAEQEKRTPEDLAHDKNTLNDLRALVAKVTPQDFAKYQCLVAQLRKLGFDKKSNKTRIVIFSERIDTLRFLADQLTRELKLKKAQSDIFYGSLDDQQQRDIISRFSTEGSDLRILLASDAASEGLNLHHQCNQLVHFDLPWSLITLEQRNGRIDRYGQKQQPVLTYLLTRPSSTKLRGDLRILDLLIEKEQVAQKNLGDVAWLLNLHDAKSEGDKIAIGIETGATPEDVLSAKSIDARQVPGEASPDDDVPATTKPNTAEPDDFLATLLDTSEPSTNATQTTEDPSLYQNELTYCKEALAALATTRDDLLVEHHEHLDGFTLHPPKDLQHRLSYLPPELLQQKEGKQPVLKLTTDRKRVMQAIEDAREEEGDWPEWQLLWEQHPVCEWLDDAVVSAFDRHEAPVLRIKNGLKAEETVFVIQGQLTNERGQPVIVEWFGISCDEQTARDVRSFRSLVEETGLNQPISNPGQALADAVKQVLAQLLPLAVAHAREHMELVRNQRMASLSEPLRNQIQRVKKWHDQRIAQFDQTRADYANKGKTIPAPKQKLLKAEEDEVRKVLKDRQDWLQEGMRTNPTPYLRIAAVLVKA